MVVHMEGFGVTNYAVDQPSYGYTTETTEFDDALIRHGVVTHQQALVAKGATPEQAQALLHGAKQQEHAAKKLQQEQKPWFEQNSTTNNNKSKEFNKEEDNDDDDDDDSFLDGDEDDDFLQHYRQQRMQELQEQGRIQQQQQKQPVVIFGEVYEISRPEWQVHVNEASMKGCWVVICLSSSDVERTGRMERSVRELAQHWSHVKFVQIPYQSAISNWPHDKLPTLFVYRYGRLQHEFVQLPIQTDVDQLATLLSTHGIGGDGGSKQDATGT